MAIKKKYSSKDIDELKELFADYLKHRLLASMPHLTFKRFLVARGRRDMCDLYDLLRRGQYTPDLMKIPFIVTAELDVNMMYPHEEYVSRTPLECSWSLSQYARYRLGVD